MLPDFNEFIVKEHQKRLEEQARQIALQRKYGPQQISLVKFAFSYLTKFTVFFLKACGRLCQGFDL